VGVKVYTEAELKKILERARPLLELVRNGVMEDFDSYAMWQAHVISQRSKCPSRQVGCVITQGKHIVTTGYNGPTTGFPHPLVCKRRELGISSGARLELCPCAHDVSNAISQAAKNGVSTYGAVLYTPTMPCTLICAPAAIGAGIKRVMVLSKKEYHSDPEAIPTLEKFKYAGMAVDEYHGPLGELLVALNAGMRLKSCDDTIEAMSVGEFIIFEGSEKCGKSTQVERLAGALIGEGYKVLTTKEPGGGFPDCRQKIFALDPEDPKLAQKELALFKEDRTEHYRKVIIPARKEGKIVLCDRNWLSTKAYQGYGRGMDLKMIGIANAEATQGVAADLIILFDISPEETLRRIKKDNETKVTRFEKEPQGFHERVRQGFLAQAKEDPEHWIVLDGTKSKEELALEVQRAVKEKLGL